MNTNKEQIKYGVYIRKSSESEDRQVQSLERQSDDLFEVIERDELSVYENPISESKSAFSPGRDGFNRLVSLTYAGKIDAWLCWHANRLSRNPIDAGTIIYLMDLGLLKHVRTPSRLYSNTSTDKMMLQIEFTMSKKDSDDKSIFVRSGLKKRYKKGLPNGKARIGFINDKYQEQGNRGILVDEERLEKVHLIFKRFLKGTDSVRTITEYARNELALKARPTKRHGHTLVMKSLVHSILCDPIYAGFFFGLDEDGKGYTRYELCSTLPRIITEDEHLRVLDILSKKRATKTQKHSRTYTGIIKGSDGNYIGIEAKYQLICDCKKKFSYINKKKCPACNIVISSMQTPKYLEYTYYYNVKRRKNKNLKAKTISETKIDKFIVDYIRENITLPSEFMEWAKRYVRTLNDTEISDNQRIVESKKIRNVNIQEEKKKLRGMFRKGMITEKEYLEDLKELEIGTHNMDKVIHVKDWMEKLDEIMDLSTEVEKILKKGTIKEKKRVLLQLGLNLIWDEENLSISNAKWMDVFKKGRKSILSKYGVFEPENNVMNTDSKTSFRTLRPVMWGWLDDVRTQYYKDYYNDLYGDDNFDIFFV